MHFCQKGSRCQMWVPWEEDDPVAWHYSGRKSVGYFGAVRVRDRKSLFCREPEMFNGETFWAFMRKLETASQETGRRVIVIIDNAKYHHAKLHAAWRLDYQERFCLDFLPPYSPELNPIERVWKRTRRNCLHNVYFPRLALVTETVEKQFARWWKPNAELAALCQLLSAINYGDKYSTRQ